VGGVVEYVLKFTQQFGCNLDDMMAKPVGFLVTFHQEIQAFMRRTLSQAEKLGH